MAYRAKITNSSRYQRRHSVYSHAQRKVGCDRPKIELAWQSSANTENAPEESHLQESVTDDGYFSLVSADSSLCPRTTKTELHVDGPAKPQRHAPETPQQQSSYSTDASPAAENIQPANVKVETLDSKLEDVSDIGNPIFESSTCRSFHVALEATTEEVCEDGSDEDSSPALSQPQASRKDEEKERYRRPGSFNKEEWRQKKDRYVNLVLADLSGQTTTDAFRELASLMNQVASQYGDNWQHPSNFTRRNFFMRYGEKQQLTLKEWQDANHRERRRFSRIPTAFRKRYS